MLEQIPVQCAGIKMRIKDLNRKLKQLQEQLETAAPVEKARIIRQMVATEMAIEKAEHDFHACLMQYAEPVFEPVPPPAMPLVINNPTPAELNKEISWKFLQKKLTEFFNGQTDPPIFRLRLHHHDHIPNGRSSPDNDPPGSDITFSMLEVKPTGGHSQLNYRPIFHLELGQLDAGYYFDNIMSSSINIAIEPLHPEPITIKIHFDTSGSQEMPSTKFYMPNMDFREFYISIKLSFACNNDAGNLDFLAWLDELVGLKNEALDKAIKKFLVVHVVTSSATETGEAAQRTMRSKIVAKLRDPKFRTALNRKISQWILGGNGSYNIKDFVNDGEVLRIKYEIPKEQWDPLPDTRPDGWPYPGNPNPDPAIDFSLPGNLGNIKHIVVLTLANRSFDHVLGYLSLPEAAGGMGRTDVDGLKGGEFNPYNGKNYPSIPLATGHSAYDLRPNNNYEAVFHQVNGGKMNGFVRSYAEESGNGDESLVMGYHQAEQVPVYDALVRDYAISHRWFSSHPGPGLCNMFYGLTGRLNLSNGSPESNLPPNTWEFNNTRPLAPVFGKTIFDYLSEYADRVDKRVTWKYYEQGYCFLRLFSKYTFDDTNILNLHDPVHGFFADAANGSLPSVSYIDSHSIGLRSQANGDGGVTDIIADQSLVEKIVEAVVTSPKFVNTLLIITYDNHGGFYDHKEPAKAAPLSGESPLKSYGLRVPAFFISPWVKGGRVFGHDEDSNGKTLYFDHCSILKTIARRFMTKDPPYLGPRYAAAEDLTSILEFTWRRPQFLPFIRYNLMYNPSQKLLNVHDSNTGPGALIEQVNKNNSCAQDFSFEDAGQGYVYIRTHAGRHYLTVDIPEDGISIIPAEGLGVRQDVKYENGKSKADPVKFNVKYQKWKLIPIGTTEREKNLYTITNAAFPDRVLRPLNPEENGSRVVLGDKSGSGAAANTWKVTSPLIKG